MADVVRHGRLRWFGHLEQKSVDDWIGCQQTESSGGKPSFV